MSSVSLNKDMVGSTSFCTFRLVLTDDHQHVGIDRAVGCEGRGKDVIHISNRSSQVQDGNEVFMFGTFLVWLKILQPAEVLQCVLVTN